MCARHLPLLAAVCMAFTAGPGANAESTVPAAPQAPPQGLPNGVVEVDRSGSGAVDYRVYYDSQGKVSREEMDYNHHGRMDTFYYYRNGVLERVEIDSKGSGSIDIWVYIADGKYIQRWERDTTGSGRPDLVRTFGVQ
jgi:hypothetical protein